MAKADTKLAATSINTAQYQELLQKKRKEIQEALERDPDVKIPQSLIALPLSQKLDIAYLIKQEKEAIAAQVKELETLMQKFQWAATIEMEENGTEVPTGEVTEDGEPVMMKVPMATAAGLLARASASLELVPTVEDWEAFWDYIYQNKAAYLLQKRAAAKAVRDIWGTGEALPGVKKFRQTKMSLTKI